jgi:hypothetical protein
MRLRLEKLELYAQYVESARCFHIISESTNERCRCNWYHALRKAQQLRPLSLAAGYGLGEVDVWLSVE